MAIFTTAATAPLLYLVWQRHPESMEGGDKAIDETTPLNTAQSESVV